MNADERRFLELNLRVMLRRLENSNGRTQQGPDAVKETTALRSEICEAAVLYLRDVIFTGVSGLYLSSEVGQMERELEMFLASSEVQKQLREALFVRSDLECFKKAADSIRLKVRAVTAVYQSHVGGERNGEKNIIAA